jgi:hypothetical protein
MKSSNSIKSTIFKAVHKLDPQALSFHLLDSLSDEQIDNLLTLADHAVMTEMREAAACIDDIPPHEFVDHAAEHSRILLNYLSIRATLRGNAR